MRRLDDGEIVPSAPDLLFAEVAHAFLRYVRAELFDIDVARDNVEFVCALPLQVWPLQRLAHAALEVAHERHLSAYDACYVALAHAEDAVLVTADRRLAAAADRAELVA